MNKRERDAMKELSDQLDSFVDTVEHLYPVVHIPKEVVNYNLTYLGLRCAVHNALYICDIVGMAITHNTLTNLNNKLEELHMTGTLV